MVKTNDVTYSISPDGNKYALPTADNYKKDFDRLANEVKHQRELGREIVVVMGLGFVGAVMAGVIATAVDSEGKPSKFVIGVQRPSARSYWKVFIINEGIPPFKSEDPLVAQIIRTSVVEQKNLVATYNEEALKLADVVVVDIQCDYHKDTLGDVENGHVEIEDLKTALRTIGALIQPHALTLIETTVPPGTTEHIAYPIIKEEFQRRGIVSEPMLAHSYERVMPGSNYVNSIRNFWRACSGINGRSKERVVQFLSDVLNTEDFPLTVMDRPIESETAKIVENSYRATLLAFMNEWSLFAEQNGVDITKVIKAIKVRPTHSNIMFPGPGIGGYCLPKDGALGMWAYCNILGGKENILKISTQAININDTRSLHVVELLQTAFQEKGLKLSDSKVTVLGASYREDVGDTRYSGSEIIVRKLTELGAEVKVHDPYCESWPEFQAGNNKSGKAVFFRKQEKLDDLPVYHDLDVALDGCDAVILAVRHRLYMELLPDQVVNMACRFQPAGLGDALKSKEMSQEGKLNAERDKDSIKRPCIIDCFGILTDKQIKRYLELGCGVKGLGRGHIVHLKSIE